MTNVSPKGVVQLKNVHPPPASPFNKENVYDKASLSHQQQDLPHWTLSAMKCLANWPKQIKIDDGRGDAAVDANFPTYPGFEQDVYEVVKDYFVGQMNRQGPLTTYKLFDIFVSAFIKAEAIGAKHQLLKPLGPTKCQTVVASRNVLEVRQKYTRWDFRPILHSSIETTLFVKV